MSFSDIAKLVSANRMAQRRGMIVTMTTRGLEQFQVQKGSLVLYRSTGIVGIFKFLKKRRIQPDEQGTSINTR